MKRWVTGCIAATGAAAVLVAGGAAPSFGATSAPAKKPHSCPSYPPRPVSISIGYDRVNAHGRYVIVARVTKQGCGGVKGAVVHFYQDGNSIGTDGTGPHGYAFKYVNLKLNTTYTFKATYNGHTATETFKTH